MGPIYEVRLSGRDITIDGETWNTIREYARSHKLFYVVYMNKVYQYTHAQTFLNRATRFEFEIVPKEDEGIIEYIYIK